MRHHERVVRVGDDDVRGGRALEDLGFRRRHRVARAEVADVRVADVDPDADVRLGDADERPNLAGVIHAELDDGDIRGVDELGQRERQADVVVEVAAVAVDAEARRQQVGRHFLRRRLAGAAGDRDDLRA